MQEGLRSVTVKLPIKMFKQIEAIAEKQGKTISETIRRLINQGLEERVYEKNAELLGKVVRTQMEQVIKSYVIFPSLDHTEHPKWIGDRIFDRRVMLNRGVSRNIIYNCNSPGYETKH
ncbi:MAG: CopG family transcriptional regulator [Peptococcaceae bacterium]|nr:CopG family transcriptional regulator [Peptococcaceae bacterium]